MGEETAVENGRISDFRGLVTLTLTLDRVILHTVMHHWSTSTYVPNVIEIEESFCGRTDERTGRQTFETHFIRSTRRSRPKKWHNYWVAPIWYACSIWPNLHLICFLIDMWQAKKAGHADGVCKETEEAEELLLLNKPLAQLISPVTHLVTLLTSSIFIIITFLVKLLCELTIRPMSHLRFCRATLSRNKSCSMQLCMSHTATLLHKQEFTNQRSLHFCNRVAPNRALLYLEKESRDYWEVARHAMSHLRFCRVIKLCEKIADLISVLDKTSISIRCLLKSLPLSSALTLGHYYLLAVHLFIIVRSSGSNV